MANRIETNFDELAFLIRRFQLGSREILDLLLRAEADSSATSFSLACQWVQENRNTWRGEPQCDSLPHPHRMCSLRCLLTFVSVGTGSNSGWLLDSYDQHKVYQL